MSFKRLDAIAPYLALIASVAAFFIWLFPLLKPFPYTDDSPCWGSPP